VPKGVVTAGEISTLVHTSREGKASCERKGSVRIRTKDVNGGPGKNEEPDRSLMLDSKKGGESVERVRSTRQSVGNKRSPPNQRRRISQKKKDRHGVLFHKPG